VSRCLRQSGHGEKMMETRLDSWDGRGCAAIIERDTEESQSLEPEARNKYLWLDSYRTRSEHALISRALHP
jgi:hypothetical protein